MASDENDFRPGDTDNNILRKILNRLKAGITAVIGPISIGAVSITPEDIEIGAVEIKDSTTDDRANIVNVVPGAGAFGLVVRNIPSGTQAVTGDFLTDAQLRATPVPVSMAAGGGLTDAELRATPVPVSMAAGGGLTDAELRASPVPVSGTVVTGGLTDAQLRATPVPVSGTVSTGGLTDAQLRASPVPIVGAVVTDGLTDAELRATPVPVSGTVSTGGLTDAQLRATPVPVSGPLTDAQLRATPVPVSGTVSTGGLTDAQLRATPVPISGTVVTGGLTDAQLRATPVPISGTVVTGGLTDAQLRATAVPVSGPLTDAQLRATPVPVSGTVVTGGLTDTQLRATAVPVSMTQLPAALVGGRLDTNIGAWLGSTAPTVGQKTMANSLPVVIASDQSAIAVTGPLTDAQLRATAVPVSGPLTDAQLRATSVSVDPRPAVLSVTVTGGANAIATATLPAVAGQFHYITHIFIKRVATAALAGGALLTVTTTNLPGTRTWRTGNQASVTVGTQEGAVLTDQEFVHPLKSSVANTNTTIVGPAAGAAVSWHMVIDYFTAP